MDRNKRRKQPASAERRPRTEERQRPVRRRSAPRRKDPDAEIVYTPPAPFNRGRFALRMITVVAVVLAILFGMSIFFKVDINKITVSGNEKYSAWDISQAAGIPEGENLLTLSKARVSGNIISQLPYVKSVRVGIKLPDTVNIEVTELDVTYSIADAEGGWWLMNGEGRIVDTTNAVSAKDVTQILGFVIQVPEIGQQAVAKEASVNTQEPSGEGEEPSEPSVTMPADTPTVPSDTIPTSIDTITGAQRLSAVLAVLPQLSKDGFATRIDSVDLTNISSIELWCEGRFQINMGDTSRAEYKINCLKAAVEKMSEYSTGQLDVSFTTWPDQVGYTPKS